MGYRWDAQTQSIRYFPDEEGDYDAGAFNPGADVPGTGSIAPGYSGSTGKITQTPEPDPYGGMGAIREAKGSPIVSRPKVYDPDTGQFFYIDETPSGQRDLAGDPIMRTTYTSIPSKPSVRQQPNIWTDANTGYRYEYDPYTGQIGSKLSELPTGGSGAGRDLRMSDSEAGNLAARRDELAYQQESGREKLAFDREKEANDQEYQDAQIELSRATLEFNQAKEEAAQKQAAIDNELKRAGLEQNAQAQADLQAYRQEQLALDRQRIDQAERQMAEAARQFAVVDARMRRQQALAEAQAGQQAEAAYIDRFGYGPGWAGNAPGFGRITPEDVTRMTQPAFRG